MRILKLSLLVLLITASASSQSLEQRAQAEKDVLAVITRQAEAWNRGDIEGFMQGYWRSDKLAFVSGDNVTRGWQATLDRYKKSYDSRAKMGTLTFSGLEVNVLSKNNAVVIGSWSLAREKDNPHGKFTLIFQKMKDGWKIIHDHTS
ncbi:MAG: DUF4440 domain-containing protein [Acidobacteria bacterium]|nr:DUF4440 domain-containing protein [Acidobacteriota bacterium]